MGLVTAVEFKAEVAAQDEKEFQEAKAAHIENPGFVDAQAEEDAKLNNAITCFALAESMLPEAKDIYTALESAIEKIVELKGVDFMFQLPDGPVVKLQEWKGQFVKPKKYEFIRTNREGETGSTGGLSLVKAREAGFKI